MRSLLRPAHIGTVVLALAGCSGNGPTPLSLQELTGTVSEAPIVGPPTEVYERIARGALACWFGGSGPLKANYVYHAEADPLSKGGKAEITIHERDRASANPKGIRAYRIGITPEQDATTLVFENLTMPEPMAKAMEGDARRWGAGGIGCAEAQSGGWSENAPAPPALPPASGKKKPSAKGGQQ